MEDEALARQFVRDGYLKVSGAIPYPIARQCAEDAWGAMGVDPQRPVTWPGPKGTAVPTTQAVAAAARADALLSTIALVAGPGRTGQPRPNLGLFIARFPSDEDSHDTGWHVDFSFHPQDLPWPEGANEYRVNVRTRGRALLLLPLFTEIGADDAPTRIRVGSHQRLAAELLPFGDEGAGAEALGGAIQRALRDDDEIALATGEPGDVYVCHPFLVHAAQLNRGSKPRLIAQPPIGLLEPYALDPTAAAIPPVERAILAGTAALS